MSLRFARKKFCAALLILRTARSAPNHFSKVNMAFESCIWLLTSGRTGSNVWPRFAKEFMGYVDNGIPDYLFFRIALDPIRFKGSDQNDSQRASRVEADEKKEPHDLPGAMRLRGLDPALG